jgi:preprotein translocase subunit SecY
MTTLPFPTARTGNIMIKAFFNILKIKELRSRLLFTAGIIILVRMAANIPCPGVDPKALSEYFGSLSQTGGSGMLGMVDLFTGGALQKFAIATLGIMPYITSSIIMQLLVPVVPSLEKLQREGESGRQKINQYTRYLTVVICFFQGTMAALAMINPGRLGMTTPESALVIENQMLFIPMTVVVLTCTTMVFMWLGEQVTERGIGNGVSIIITINIIARLPAACFQLYDMAINRTTIGGQTFKPVHLLLLVIVFIAVTSATIMLTQGVRRVPIHMVRKTIGNQMQGGTTYMPLKVNFSGVMPIIFGGAIMMIPGVVLNWLAQRLDFPFLFKVAAAIRYGSPGYMICYGALIMAFAYFWVANMFNPIQIADNLKREKAYIPGIRPGQPTADFLDNTMTRITFSGAIFLTALAIFPMFLGNEFKIPMMIASFFGGTSLLIMVGVVLDTMSQLESHLTMRNYDGFMKKGRIKGRRAGGVSGQ